MMHIATDLEIELVQTVLDYYHAQSHELEKAIDESEYWSLQKSRAACGGDDLADRGREEDRKVLDKTYRTETWAFFGRLTGSQWQHENRSRFLSPLQHAPFAPWRRSGFAICTLYLHQPPFLLVFSLSTTTPANCSLLRGSTSRMSSYGLLQSCSDGPSGLDIPIFEAWASLLTEGEREEIQRENKRQEVLAMMIQRPASIIGGVGSVTDWKA